MELHERVKLARERKYRTAREASEMTGIPYGTLTGHESGARGIRDKALRKYADLYRVELPWLRYEQGPMTNEGSKTIKAIVDDLEQLDPSQLPLARDLIRTLRRSR